MTDSSVSENFGGLKIGVLALQGAFREHIARLRKLGAHVVEVRLARDLDGLDGLIIPGGESTAIGKLMADFGLLEPAKAQIAGGLPTWGTCAGAILLAKDLGGQRQPIIGAMDIRVRRNAFGSQLDSFETTLDVPELGDAPVPAVFIRAPLIDAVGADVEVLARLDITAEQIAPTANWQVDMGGQCRSEAAATAPSRTDVSGDRNGHKGDGRIIVAARQGRLLATAFHPELTDDSRFHQYFLRMVAQAKAEQPA